MTNCSEKELARLTERLREVEAEFGPKTDINLFLSLSSNGVIACACHVCPKGIVNDDYYIGRASNFDTAIDRAVENAREHMNGTAVIRQLALTIIDKADGSGACDQADLIAAGFSSGQIDQIGERAVQEADRLTGGRPFSITHPANEQAA